MNSQIIRFLAPLAAAIAGTGIGYLGGGGAAPRWAAAIPAAGAPALKKEPQLEIPYPATMEGALRATAENTGTRREWLLDALTAKMTAAELEATAGRIESLVRDEQYVVLPRVIGAWAALDPEGAERWLLRHAPTFRKGATTFLVTLDAYAKKQPARAFALLDALPPGDRRERLAATAAAELAKFSPRQAADFAAAVKDDAARKLALEGVLDGLAHADPLAALARLKDMPAEKRESFVGTALNRLFMRDAVSGFAELEKLPATEQQEHIYNLAWRFAERSPQAFADYVTKHAATSDNSRTSYAASYAATAMAATNPARAIEWAQSLPEDTRDNALGGALGAWAASDPKAALDWALKNKPAKTEEATTRIRSYLDGAMWASVPDYLEGSHIRTVLSQWAGADPGAALAWAKTPEGAPHRQQVAAAVIPSMLSEGRTAEARELIGQLPPEQQKYAIRRAVASAVRTDPAQAAEWLATMPEDESTPMLHANLIQNWAAQDIAASAVWIETLPQGAARDSAALAYAQSITNTDPTAAMEWVLGTTASAERQGTLVPIYYRWLREQPDAAAAWLRDAQDLSDAERETLQSISR